MRARSAAWMTMAAALVATAGARAAEPRGDDADMARWIERACPKESGIESMVRLDQVAGKAIMDRLRQGKYRSAVGMANAYLGCWDRQDEGLRKGLFASRLRDLRQVSCLVPLVVFESEAAVDPDLARASLKACPEPPESPAGKDEAVQRAWAEDVRRRMHLSAASQPPAEVLAEAERGLARMKAAGIVGDDGAARWASKAGKAGGEGRDGGGDVAAEGTGEAGAARASSGDREAPDPVFAIRVLAAGAAVAAGDFDRLMSAFGGEEAACSSMFLAALGFLQAVEMPRQAALPMILRSMVARAPLDTVAALSDRVSGRFQGRPCAAQAMVSSLGLSSLSAEAVDAAVKEGRADRVVRLAAAAPSVIPVRGTPASRVAILGDLVGRLKGNERAERLCQLGDARGDSGDVDGALAAFALAAEPGAAGDTRSEIARACPVEGRLRALVRGGRTGDPSFREAATAWLARDPTSREVLARVLEPGNDDLRAAAVQAMAAVVAAKDAPARATVLEALLKVVDDEPGSRAAAAALAAVDASGFPEDAEGKVTWALVSGRHFATAGDAARARKAFDRAFAALRPGMESARGGAVALVRWAAIDGRYAWLDDLVARARKAGLLTPSLLADLAGMVGEVGERDRARRLVAMARALKPASPEEWIALADASARIDDVATATRDLRRAGPEDDWGPEAWMVQGRIATAKGSHRDAVVAYGKAVERQPGECQPRFFHGLALLLVGDPEGAESDFAGCVDDGNLGPQVLGALGYAQFDQSRFDDAEATFRRALQRDSTTADNHLGLAMVLLRKGDEDGALASWARAVMLEPVLDKGPKAAARKGFIYSDVQKKAWDDLRAARDVRKGGGK